VVRVVSVLCDREVTEEEYSAVVKLSALWRGYYVRKVNEARVTGIQCI